MAAHPKWPDLVTRALAVDVYQPTAEFLAIPLHTAVCEAESREVVAVTGPADHAASAQDAAVFVAAHELVAMVQRLERALATHLLDLTNEHRPPLKHAAEYCPCWAEEIEPARELLERLGAKVLR